MDPAFIEAYLRTATPKQLRSALSSFLPADASPAEKVAAIEQVLVSPAGVSLRDAMGRWVVEQVVPVSALVPESYARWRPIVRDAMLYVMSHLSAARLAPKLLEQLDLPPRTSPEKRLLRLIGKVPGLQKLGQVLARNANLRPAMRRALIELENGIHDVEIRDIREIIRRNLGPRLPAFDVRLARKLLCEASVSAIVRFTWRNPETGAREHGVFKVLKPHIAACFPEDMQLLHGLTQFFSKRLRQYGFAGNALPDTFAKVRRLLQHEVNFPGEQKTLGEAHNFYRFIPGVRVPQLIAPLCTENITAMSYERGVKVTTAAVKMSKPEQQHLAQQLLEAVVAAPLFSGAADALFHADPHAGNLLYDRDRRELVLLDWALIDRLSRKQRRYLALLFLTVGLRDPVGVREAISALSQNALTPRQQRVIRDFVPHYLDQLPLNRLPSSVDAMRLVEHLAVKGIRFPAPLIMLSKVLFTLDGILHDIGATSPWVGFTIGQHLVRRWMRRPSTVGWPLHASDWLSLQCSALLLSGRLLLKCEEAMFERMLPRPKPAPAGAPTSG